MTSLQTSRGTCHGHVTGMSRATNSSKRSGEQESRGVTPVTAKTLKDLCSAINGLSEGSGGGIYLYL